MLCTECCLTAYLESKNSKGFEVCDKLSCIKQFTDIYLSVVNILVTVDNGLTQLYSDSLDVQGVLCL